MAIVDPLGLQPRPTSGNQTPDWSSERVEKAMIGVDLIWVEHGPQEGIVSALKTYVAVNRHVRGVPLDGRRLSQFYQAGKSAIALRLKKVLMAEDIASGREPNPHQVLIVTVNRRTTLRQFYQTILAMLEDAFHDVERLGHDERARERRRRERRSSEALQNMVADWVLRLGVELLVVDEVQRLDRVSDDAEDVTEELQTFCDRGIVPVLLIGNERSAPFLQRNRELAVRLGTPFELKPLDFDDDHQARLFIAFCKEFDRLLVSSDCMPQLSGLESPTIIDGLYAASSGHVGRVARILKEALSHAAAREASLIEAHDLSKAIRQYAIGVGWIDRDPFSRSRSSR